MFSSSGFLLLCATLATVAQCEPPLPPKAVLPNQQGLAHLFFSSRITQQDPMQSMACFADYIAESNDISKNYGSDYNACFLNASATRKQIDFEAFNQRMGIESLSESVCTRMRTCNEHNSTLDMFNCHANVGSNNTKEAYMISGNSTEYSTVLQERYRLIDLHYGKCCHAAERTYVENTAQNYNHLQACLDGRAEPRPPKTTTTLPPTTTTTTSTTTTTTTTEAPPETTVATVPIQEQFAQLLNLLN